jgi:large subunit ribosomal protein L25
MGARRGDIQFEEVYAMPQQVEFAVERREVLGKKVSRLRRQGIIPGNIFGGGKASVPIQLDGHTFERFLATHGATTVLALRIAGGSAETTIVRHVQHEPVTGKIEHVDFQHVEMSQPMKARVPIRLRGVSLAVKIFDGVLLHLLDAVEVEALPANLPDAVEVDISGLEELKATLHVRDLEIPQGVTVLTDADETIVKVEPPRVAVEEIPAAVAPAPAEGQEAVPGAEATKE